MTEDTYQFDRANRLKLLINSLNITGKAFANEIGVSQGMISNLTNGKRALSIEVVDKITLRYTDVSPAWLFFGFGAMHKIQDNKISMVEEKQAVYGLPRSIALHDLADIILSIQEENAELRRRIEALEQSAACNHSAKPKRLP